MIKVQIAYKISSEEKELQFVILQGASIETILYNFVENNKEAIIYCVLRCGKP